MDDKRRGRSPDIWIVRKVFTSFLSDDEAYRKIEQKAMGIFCSPKNSPKNPDTVCGQNPGGRSIDTQLINFYKNVDSVSEFFQLGSSLQAHSFKA